MTDVRAHAETSRFATSIRIPGDLMTISQRPIRCSRCSAGPCHQMFSSAMTIISVFIGMLVTNVWLTLFVLLGVCVMLKVVKKLGGQSAKCSSSSRSRSTGSTAISRRK